MTASQSQSQSHCSDVDHLTLLMLNSRLVEDGELWFPQIKLLIMCPVVQLQSIICVHESSSCFACSLTLSIIAIQSRSMVRFLDTFRRLPHTASFSLLQHYFGLNSSSLRGNFQHDDKRPLIIIAMFAIFFLSSSLFLKIDDKYALWNFDEAPSFRGLAKGLPLYHWDTIFRQSQWLRRLLLT